MNKPFKKQRGFTVEVYAKGTGNVLTSRTGFATIEAAIDWGEDAAAEYGDEADCRVFPSQTVGVIKDAE